MTVEFKYLVKENCYKTLSTILLAIGFSMSSYFGIYLKNSVFGEDVSDINFALCLTYLIFGIIFLVLATYCGCRIDQAKGVEKK